MSQLSVPHPTSYDQGTDSLSQRLLTTSDDFVDTNEIVLGTESNATPVIQFHPYIGDFFDLTSVREHVLRGIL